MCNDRPGTRLDVGRQAEGCKAAGAVNLLRTQLPYDPLWETSECACDGLDLPLTCSKAPHNSQALSVVGALWCHLEVSQGRQKAAAALNKQQLESGPIYGLALIAHTPEQHREHGGL